MGGSKKRNIIICNNVYQIVVAMWITYLNDDHEMWDIIISDHMNDSKILVKRLKRLGIFKEIFYVETMRLVANQDRPSKYNRVMNMLFPMRGLKEYVELRKKYTDIYFANFDNFTQVLYNALQHRNRDIKLHAYEEGLASYSSFSKYYDQLQYYYGYNHKGIKKFIHKYIYRTKLVYGNLSDFFMFNPELLQWNPQCKVREIKKIDIANDKFRKMVNQVFDYKDDYNEYDRKYIFFEESFAANGTPVNDIELVEEIAKIVGKENLIVKIHPRNPVNRFGKIGYKTNVNTSIPWEVIVMNMGDISDKVLITVASSCILNPIIVFGKDIKAFSLYDCLDTVPPILKDGYWDLVEKVYKQYPDLIVRCVDVNEIGK